jgi:hypothetical protein
MGVSPLKMPTPPKHDEKEETIDYTDYTDFFVFSSCPLYNKFLPVPNATRIRIAAGVCLYRQQNAFYMHL